MNPVDFIFLAVWLIALTAMLACSPILRAIVWDTLRHPFTPSRVTCNDGKVQVIHEPTGEPAGER